MIEYTEGDFIANPIAFDIGIREYYSLFGLNRVYQPFLGITGSPQRPSFSFQDHERTGFYLHDPFTDAVGLSIFGFPCYIFENGAFTVKNFFGDSAKLTIQDGNYEINFPAKNGTLATLDDVGASIYSEVPVGLIDGSNRVYTVTNTISKILNIELNGLGGEAYTITGANEFTLDDYPLTGDTLKVIYIK